MKESFAIIGGSGVYELFEDSEKISLETKWGKVGNISKIEKAGRKIYFLPRHGSDHSVPPHLINYHANIAALYELRIKRIFATNAVGSLVPEIKPGDFVIPDQIIDFTKNRKLTFFDGKTSFSFEDGTELNGVVHIDCTEPYCSSIRSVFSNLINKQNEQVHTVGTYVCSEGPRFETPAEVKMYQKIGGTLAGMTTVPEAFLARELKMCYSTLCLITNYGAGMQKTVSHEEVIEIFNKKTATIRRIMEEIIELEEIPKRCSCQK